MGNSLGDRPETGEGDSKTGYPEGKALYEERMKLLPGLWMPPAPPWEELPEATRARWQRTAEEADDQAEQANG
ncbi:hypothetical protein H9638_13795 [Arthrobacter sp. Sa2BUA2]|uniref:Uncharacterized protein n=1 Tax=Arthrobacter pullicola TaxID=2762224 RepID=A0ABR8YKW0_9MICC|nr:hypothetical protein [Arthrobacter pullicola]MBD8044880.1 hypothetical protein [Arthrobacter pullicola]